MSAFLGTKRNFSSGSQRFFLVWNTITWAECSVFNQKLLVQWAMSLILACINKASWDVGLGGRGASFGQGGGREGAGGREGKEGGEERERGGRERKGRWIGCCLCDSGEFSKERYTLCLLVPALLPQLLSTIWIWLSRGVRFPAMLRWSGQSCRQGLYHDCLPWPPTGAWLWFLGWVPFISRFLPCCHEISFLWHCHFCKILEGEPCMVSGAGMLPPGHYAPEPSNCCCSRRFVPLLPLHSISLDRMNQLCSLATAPCFLRPELSWWGSNRQR